MTAKKQVAPKVTASEVAQVVAQVKQIEETLPELDSIVLDTEAKQAFRKVLDAYKKQNPVKFASKEKAFVKKMLSL